MRITDPQCSPIKLTALSKRVYMNNFLETVNYMTIAIDMVQCNTNPSLQQVGQMQSSMRSVKKQVLK
jgi:hypothetical protein